MKSTVLTCIGLMIVSHAVRSEETPRETTGKMGPCSLRVIENGMVRVGVAPEIGGRILELRRLPDGRNRCRVETEFLGRAPLDSVYGYGLNYGGIWDVGSPDWPGAAFWSAPYAITVENSKEEIILIARAEVSNTKIERRMILKSGRAAVKIRVKETNSGPYPHRMMIRIHNELLPGQKGALIAMPTRESFVGFFSDIPKSLPEGIELFPFVVGAEEDRGLRQLNEGWCAATCWGDNETIVETMDISRSKKLLFWAGGSAYEGDYITFHELPDDMRGFFNFEHFGEEVLLKPGESISGEVEFWLLKDAGNVMAVGGDVALALEANRQAKEVAFMLKVSSPSAKKALKVSIAVDPNSDQLAPISKPIDIPAGGAAEASGNFPNVAPSVARIMARVEDAQGKTLCQASVKLK